MSSVSDRAFAAERQVTILQARVRSLNQEKLQLRADLAKSQHELQLWKVQLDLAQKEIFRAQAVVDQVDRARVDAEDRAHRYRQRIRHLLEERSIQVAIDEGRREGFKEGLEFGRRSQLQLSADFRSSAAPIYVPRPPARPPSTTPTSVIRPPARPPSTTPARPSSTRPQTAALNPPTTRPPSTAPTVRPPSTHPPPSTAPISTTDLRSAPSIISAHARPPSTAPPPVPPIPLAPTSAPDLDPPEHPEHNHPLPIPPDNFIPVILHGQSEISLPPPHEWVTRPRSDSRTGTSAGVGLVSASVKSPELSSPKPPSAASTSRISLSQFGLVATPNVDDVLEHRTRPPLTQPERIAEEWRSHNPDMLTPSVSDDSRPITAPEDIIPRPMSSDPIPIHATSTINHHFNPPQRPTTTDPSQGYGDARAHARSRTHKTRTTSTGRPPPVVQQQPPPPHSQPQPQLKPQPPLSDPEPHSRPSSRPISKPIPVSNIFYDHNSDTGKNPSAASSSGDWLRSNFQRNRSQSVTQVSTKTESSSSVSIKTNTKAEGTLPHHPSQVHFHPPFHEPIERPATVAPSISTTAGSTYGIKPSYPYMNNIPYIPRPPSTTTTTATVATTTLLAARERERSSINDTNDNKKHLVPSLSPIPTLSNLTSIPESHSDGDDEVTNENRGSRKSFMKMNGNKNISEEESLPNRVPIRPSSAQAFSTTGKVIGNVKNQPRQQQHSNNDYFSSIPDNLGTPKSIFSGRGVPYYYDDNDHHHHHNHHQRLGVMGYQSSIPQRDDIVVMNATTRVGVMPGIPEHNNSNSLISPARLDRPLSLFSDT